MLLTSDAKCFFLYAKFNIFVVVVLSGDRDKIVILSDHRDQSLVIPDVEDQANVYATGLAREQSIAISAIHEKLTATGATEKFLVVIVS